MVVSSIAGIGHPPVWTLGSPAPGDAQSTIPETPTAARCKSAPAPETHYRRGQPYPCRCAAARFCCPSVGAAASGKCTANTHRCQRIAIRCPRQVSSGYTLRPSALAVHPCQPVDLPIAVQEVCPLPCCCCSANCPVTTPPSAASNAATSAALPSVSKCHSLALAPRPYNRRDLANSATLPGA